MSESVREVRGGGSRVVVVLVMVVGILSLSAWAWAFFQRCSLPPYWSGGYIECWSDFEHTDSYRVTGPRGAGNVLADCVFLWPGIPLDADSFSSLSDADSFGGYHVRQQVLFHRGAGSGSDDSNAAVIVPKWFSDEFFNWLVEMLFGSGLLLCLVGAYALFSRWRSGSSGDGHAAVERSDEASARFVVRRQGLVWVGALFFGLGLFLMCRSILTYFTYSSVRVDEIYRDILDVFRLGVGSFAFGIVFFLVSRRRFCRVVAGLGCFVVGIMDLYVLFVQFALLSRQANAWFQMPSVFELARALYVFLLALLVFASVGVVVVGVLALRGKFEFGNTLHLGGRTRAVSYSVPL